MQEQLCCDVEMVTKVINEFNEIVAKLSSAEVRKFSLRIVLGGEHIYIYIWKDWRWNIKTLENINILSPLESQSLSSNLKWLIFILHVICQQIHFLRDKLYETESVIQMGLGRYTWQTLNIKSYCATCQRLLKNLAAIVSQISYMGRDIKKRVSDLESYSLFSFQKDKLKTDKSQVRDILFFFRKFLRKNVIWKAFVGKSS